MEQSQVIKIKETLSVALIITNFQQHALNSKDLKKQEGRYDLKLLLMGQEILIGSHFIHFAKSQLSI